MGCAAGADSTVSEHGHHCGDLSATGESIPTNGFLSIAGITAPLGSSRRSPTFRPKDCVDGVTSPAAAQRRPRRAKRRGNARSREDGYATVPRGSAEINIECRERGLMVDGDVQCAAVGQLQAGSCSQFGQA